MTPWLADPDVTLFHGDCLDVLRELPDRSVQMCATSPPFYGLRDYGTGEWEGGDPDCDHMKEPNPIRRTGISGLNGGTKTQGHSQEGYGVVCGRCGARRVDQQIGLEETPDMWVDRLVAVFREVRRVLRDDGTLWVEIGDSYASSPKGNPGALSDGLTNQGRNAAAANMHRTRSTVVDGLKQKDMIGQPWLLAFALRADGWYLRSEIIWARPNPMPESVTDRPTKSHSTVFLLSKRPRYFYDADAIRQPHETYLPANHTSRQPQTSTKKYTSNGQARGKEGPRFLNEAGANARSVWTIPTEPTPYAHFATWPQQLVRRMILAGTSEHGCCPECGAPWVRQTERDDKVVWKEGTGTQGPYISQTIPRHYGTRDGRPNGNALPTPSVRTLGWSPSCHHDTQPVPCTVLDPFAGSGTTNLVARNHGRHSIGIELNQAYLEIAATRLQQLSLLA